MRCGSPPGSTTIASLVSGQPSTEQLHWKSPTGNVSRSSTERTIAERKLARGDGATINLDMGVWAILLIGIQAAALQTNPKIHGRVRTPQKRTQPAPKATRVRPTYPPVELFAVNLNEPLRYRPFDAAGR